MTSAKTAPMSRVVQGVGRLRLPLRHRHWTATMWWTVALGTVALGAPVLLGLPNPVIAIIPTGLLVAALLSLAREAPGGLWAPPSLYLAVIGVFHLGLAPFWIMGVDPGLPRAFDLQWYTGPLGAHALWLVALGVASFAAAAHAVMALSAPLPTTPLFDADSRAARLLSAAGAVVVVVGVWLWFTLALRAGGAGVFFIGYLEFREYLSGSLLGVLYQPISIGIGLMMIGRIRSTTAIALGAYGAWALVAFTVGMRGEVLYATIAALGVLSLRARLLNPLTTFVAGFLLLTLVNLVQQLRLMQSPVVDGALNVSPLGGLAELGQTVRVVAVTSSWHLEDGEPFAGGATYTVAVARALESVVGSASAERDIDPRLFNQLILSREGPIGGSIIGEAFHNGGPGAVVLALAVAGAALAWFASMTRSPWHAAAAVAVMVPLTYHVRNGFVPVIPWILAAAVLIVALALLDRLAGQRRSQLRHMRS